MSVLESEDDGSAAGAAIILTLKREQPPQAAWKANGKGSDELNILLADQDRYGNIKTKCF